MRRYQYAFTACIVIALLVFGNVSFGVYLSNQLFNEINEIMQTSSYVRYDETKPDISIYEELSENGNPTLNYERINTSGDAYNKLTFEDCGSIENAVRVFDAFKSHKKDLTYVEASVFPYQEMNIDVEIAVLYSKEQEKGEKHNVEPTVKIVASRIGQVVIYEYDGGLWSINSMLVNYKMFYGLLSKSEYSQLDYDFYINEEYKAFVADGKSKIEIHLEFPEELNGSFELEYDKLNGIIEGFEPFTEVKVSDSKRIFKLYYIPVTEGIDNEDYMTPMGIKPQWGEEKLVWLREDFIKLKFTKEDDTYLDSELKIKIARPPVVFVHGFLGGVDTWKSLDDYLSDNLKYQTMRLSYYNEFEGEQSVKAQAEKLFFDIELLDQAYSNSGIKMNKVDLICHSMGGLVARYLTTEHDLYDGNVRKLIMVGTPNHGCSYVDLNAGRIMAYISDAHRGAAEELYSGSSLIKSLNKNEATGGHLSPDVEYAIIYGKGIYGGDGIVTESSAILNGVRSFDLEKHLHSDSMDYGFNDSLTESSQVKEIIKNLLNEFIERIPLSEQVYEISNTSGDVRIYRDGVKEEILSEGTKNLKFYNGDIIRTGKESAALISLKADGRAYGDIYLKNDTEIDIINASANRIDVVLRNGGARFVTYGGSDKHFSVEAYSKQNAYTVQRITGLDTDFSIDISDEGQTNFVLIEGKAVVEAIDFKNNLINNQIVAEKTRIKAVGMEMNIEESFNVNDSENWWIKLESLKKSGNSKESSFNLPNYYIFILVGLVVIIGVFVAIRKSKNKK